MEEGKFIKTIKATWPVILLVVSGITAYYALVGRVGILEVNQTAIQTAHAQLIPQVDDLKTSEKLDAQAIQTIQNDLTDIKNTESRIENKVDKILLR